MDSLANIEKDEEIPKYLLRNFLMLNSRFRSKRRSSGMPKEIISHINKSDELNFVITGSKAQTLQSRENLW